MNTRMLFGGLSASLVALVSCGQTLDIGSRSNQGPATVPRCRAAGAPAEVLSSFDELPDFSPLAIVVVGGDVYAGGVSYPQRAFDENAPDIGRLVRVPTTGGALREVWKGPYFAGPLRAFDTRIGFLETDPNNRTPFPTHGGVDLFDTITEQTTRVPNAAGRNYVVSFEIGGAGVFWSGGTVARASADSISMKPGFTVARWRDESTGQEPLFESDESSSFLRRGDEVLANVVLDTASGGSRLAVYRAGDAFELERELSEVSVAKGVGAPVTVATSADADFYYLSTTQSGMQHESRIPRAKTEGVSFGEPISGFAFGAPLVDRGVVFWVPTTDRSMVRRHRLDGSPQDAHTGEELALDSRRWISSLVADECNVYWLSHSDFDAQQPYRLMVHAR